MSIVKEYTSITDTAKGGNTMKIRSNLRTKMSSKGQVVIPKCIRTQVESIEFDVEYSNGVIKLTPVDKEDRFFDFTGDIVKELVEEGYKGEDLKKEISARKAIVDKAFELWIDEIENDNDSLISTEEIRKMRKRK